MKNSPLISIIIPAYNIDKYIGDTLQSVHNQSYINLECIIIDDGSQDKTAEIVKKWKYKDKRFIYIYKENSGVTDSRNMGIDNANGELIVFLDSDDLLTKNSLEVRLKILQDENVDLVYCNAYRIIKSNLTNEPLRDINIGLFSGKSGLISFLLNNNATTSTVICKRSSLVKIGKFNWNKNAEDLYCWLELLLDGAKIYGIPDFLVYYRELDNSLSSVDRRCTKEIIEIIDDLKYRLINENINHKIYLNQWIRNYILLFDLNELKSRLIIVNKIVSEYFPLFLIYLPFGKKLRKLLAIRVMNKHKSLE